MAVSIVAIAVATSGVAAGSAHASDDHRDHGNAFRQVNLVSDLASVHPLVVDDEVKNPWGIAFGPHTPLWVSNNFNPALADCGEGCIPQPEDLLTKITVYAGANGHDPFVKLPLEVTASAPTGIVFNPTKKFVVEQGGVRASADFLFNEVVVNATATAPLAEVTAWSKASTPLPTNTVATNANHDGAFYNGLALVPGKSDDDDSGRSSGSADSKKSQEHARSGPRLIAVGSLADETGTPVVDVFDGSFNKLDVGNAFIDPHSEGLAPYNVAYLDGRVYIAYSSFDGTGAVSVFSRNGAFLKRLVTGAPLASPWGMAIAPEEWGEFGGALLVGNVDDGTIQAFNRKNGHPRGTVSDANGNAIVNPGLWGLAFGNGTIGTPRTLLFAAGIGSAPGGLGQDVYAHGLVGLIKPVDHRGGDDSRDD